MNDYSSPNLSKKTLQYPGAVCRMLPVIPMGFSQGRGQRED